MKIIEKKTSFLQFKKILKIQIKQLIIYLLVVVNITKYINGQIMCVLGNF
jgi:hypothetical protein